MKSLVVILLLTACLSAQGQGFCRSVPFLGAANHWRTSTPITGETNLVAQWMFDNDPLDSSTNGYNGTLVNGPTFGIAEDGSGNGALWFAEEFSESMIASNTATVANGLSSFTVTCWFSVNNTDDPPPTYRAIVCKVNASGVGNTGIGWAIRSGTPADGTTSKIGAFILDGTNWEGYYTPDISDDGWYHITLVVYGSTATVYFNGSTIGTTHNYSGTVGSFANTSDIMFGQSPAGQFNTGGVDDTRIYSYAMSASAVAALYAAGAQ